MIDNEKFLQQADLALAVHCADGRGAVVTTFYGGNGALIPWLGHSEMPWRVLVLKAASHSVAWDLFEVGSQDPDRPKATPLYAHKDESCRPAKEAQRLAEAATLASGFVKWDGCCDLHLDAHTCEEGEEAALLDTVVMARKLARGLWGIPHVAEDAPHYSGAPGWRELGVVG